MFLMINPTRNHFKPSKNTQKSAKTNFISKNVADFVKTTVIKLLYVFQQRRKLQSPT